MQKRSSRETQSATDKGAGPRPKGTDGTDHKFRQRVNSHYKLMAVGRSRLGLVTKLHAAHCVVATLTLLAAYVGAAGPSVPHAVAAGVTALGAGACAYRAAAAAKSSVAPPTEQYASLVVAVGGLVLLALVAAVGEVVMATKSVSHAQLAIPAQLLGFIASAVGHDGASKLIAALAEAKGSRAQ
ncbi:hypothetical protein T492DRAFT_1005536 [Pavlovales sp. CCMP2436]|nr:hypothetical protein T492DRAFT_1005536 [Pavlovales sp. CCMP2436]